MAGEREEIAGLLQAVFNDFSFSPVCRVKFDVLRVFVGLRFRFAVAWPSGLALNWRL